MIGTPRTEDEAWMRVALTSARQAMKADEVPIGAALVNAAGELSATAGNCTHHNPLGHAEKLVIEEIINRGEKYLYGYTLYVTIEPCLMCAGLLIWSRLGRLVYGASDPKAGAVGSVYNVLADRSFNHRPEVVSGVLADDCRELIQSFFQQKRAESCRSG